jgi:hypothetical protein
MRGSGGAGSARTVEWFEFTEEAPMHDSGTTVDDARRPRSLPVRIAVWSLVLVLSIVVLLGLAHVFVQPISPEQEPPSRHAGEPCLLCHLVLDNAELVDVK